ncbi:uncharacterized protein LKV04_015920 [Tautogolabrus adspersus]
MFNQKRRQVAAFTGVIIMLTFYKIIFHTRLQEDVQEDVYQTEKLRFIPTIPTPSPGPCSCPKGSYILKDHIPEDQYEELFNRRAKEFQQHKARTTTVLSKLLFAAPNSPLKYPIQGFTVRPMTPTLIPGDGETQLTIEAESLVILNHRLSKVSYTSTVYHTHTGDLALFKFENHEAVFPITIKVPQLPVLYDMGTDINSHVTITTKTFLRYTNLNVLISSIRNFYSNITIIIADDSLVPQNITGDNIQQYIMPPAQGWFAGRNLAVSQVTTKYFLWVDDDFVFTENTKIEKLVEIMEAFPELDVLGGTVNGNQFYFTLEYEEGEEMDGGCLNRKSRGSFKSLPGYPHCSWTSGVVNFFLARTDAAQKVGFDPKLQRVAHSEFFMDGLGSLMVATCNHVSIGHQPRKSNKDTNKYSQFRNPGIRDLQRERRPRARRDRTFLLSIQVSLDDDDEDEDAQVAAMRMLFIDYSSAFNTIPPPYNLATKLIHLGLNTHLCSWIHDFLTDRPQTVRMGKHVSSSIILNTAKTKEMILDFRRLNPNAHCPINIDGERVEVVQSFKYLGVHISQDATWSVNTTAMAKKGLQRLHFLRCLKKARLPQQLLVNFYRSAIESVITYCITAWYSGCTLENRKSLQRIIRTAERITGSQLPRLEDIHRTRCTRKATAIIRDITHPGHTMFTPLPSGKRYRVLYAHTTRLRNSF